MALSEAGADWLDAHCWRCGSERARPDADGRVLCGACRRDLFGTPLPSVDALQAARELSWDSHALERCWRCMSRAVDQDDDLGLCTECRRALARP